MKQDTNYLFNVVGAVFSAIQTNEVLSWISWGITLLATILSISFTIYKWYKKAHEDGKIDKEEVEELGRIVKDASDELKEKSKHDKM